MPWGAAVAAVAGAVGTASSASSATRKAKQMNTDRIREQARQFDITQEEAKPWREAGVRGLDRFEGMVGGQGAYEQGIRSNVPDSFVSSKDVPEAFSFNREDFNKYKDPGYEFRKEESMRGLDRRLARSGNRGSGYSSRALMELSQNLASQEFGAARGRAREDYQSEIGREKELYQRDLRDYGFAVDREEATYGRDIDRYKRQYTDTLNRYASMADLGQTATADLGRQRQSYARDIGQTMQSSGEYDAAAQLSKGSAYAGAARSLGDIYQQYQAKQQYQNNQYNQRYNRPAQVRGDAYMPARTYNG